MKYIDAEKLKAEIERLEVLYDEALKNPSFASYESSLIAKGKHRQREDLLCFIDSLQQEHPEVDLEKIIEQTYHDGSVADTSDMDHVAYDNIARHFYELGVNARKEESK